MFLCFSFFDTAVVVIVGVAAPDVATAVVAVVAVVFGFLVVEVVADWDCSSCCCCCSRGCNKLQLVTDK